MIRLTRKKLGTLLRGARGYFRNRMETVPPVPGDLSAEVIGTSVGGRGMLSYHIGNGPRVIAFCGAIHGNEVGTPKLIRSLIAYLNAKKEWHADFTFLCIPVLNPDGYAMALARPDYSNGGRIGRFNANGVDLNRNFPTRSFASTSVWSHGKGYTETTQVSCGATPGSEPENVALRSFLMRENVSLLWMFHSVASEIMAGHDAPTEALAGVFARVTGFRHATHAEWQTLHQTGTAKEWCEENGIMYLESEASERWGSDWNRQKPGIVAVLHALAQ